MNQRGELLLLQLRGVHKEDKLHLGIQTVLLRETVMEVQEERAQLSQPNDTVEGVESKQDLDEPVVSAPWVQQHLPKTLGHLLPGGHPSLRAVVVALQVIEQLFPRECG